MKILDYALLIVIISVSIVACNNEEEKEMDIDTSSMMTGLWMNNGSGVVKYIILDFRKDGVVKMFNVSGGIEVEDSDFNFKYTYNETSKMLRFIDVVSGSNVSYAVSWKSENEYVLEMRSCDDIIKYSNWGNFFNTSQWKTWYRR